MADPRSLTTIDELIDNGQFDAAREELDKLARDPHSDVLRIKLGFREQRLEPATAMQRLVSLMRAAPSTPGAQQLYQEVSKRAYETSGSTMAHSHPPPRRK